MNKKKMSKSIKVYIRREKARIRKTVLSLKKQKELINELYKKCEPRREISIKNNRGGNSI
ncbi:MAG: hypothetical protein A2365_01220 [Candidatus Nealsonbacteria bacterium RIFOXYB1_FULL_40_15]|uniref:Uncharacterized protein n=2 Tax=Candidatus Nealsoniibacteriota TaxID=1817911 RepID=A0A1G2ELE6_9BACT|nr:MAG: hypothetical protein A2427_04750 [Candidatus Nealsonbacteria bacterium RIFOXYC1_FULL_40_7]OGZ26890.1 MAG: hypothetical protein A2365_01220 [Candidatus Nealsonbacteria bacterium RIFOXYB1_FULL_40_15]OGZ29315.1 MAG: hypothetical protein A2562_01675 [Candidatus Nealsonbacteria bacterium RIFOXYD1_FULL_39_11]